MKRRKFINTTIAASAGTLIGASIPVKAQSKTEEKKYACKITVLKKTFNEDYVNEFRGGKGSICNVFEEGLEFMVKSIWEKPEKFCDWAWKDIHPYITTFITGGNFSEGDLFNSWMKDKDTMIACCTDGIRPVVFEIKRIKENNK